ncbi:ATP-dependent DNA helicase [Paenibacillus contaminans]|uniref:ATP-dependent DNA helicase n=1 Tax=Paenibacillus contaminans TaxID=450362 RepID=A0A329M807_9BACL|nr:ATP-dependent DNA helicase [Paenibacillus contaminans]RAV15316.1 ATP-dependent DNA helicase [Paenibacillus contaminans]
MSHTVQISVRALVEYAFRSGSIESGFRTSQALTDGTKAHLKIQKQYGEKDQKEVFLRTEIAGSGMLFAIEGRCDGLLVSEEDVTVDEIKSTSGDLHVIADDTYPVHWAQAKCYAYMYAKAHGLSRMRVQLTYVQVNTDEQKRFAQDASFEELEGFVLRLVEAYAPYAALMHKHESERTESIKALPFPFESYREGQRKFAGTVYKTIADGRKLFAKAPTGMGKTISTLFPAVKAMGEGLLQQFFYLTAKTIVRTAAEEALGLLCAKGLHVHAVTLTAKEKVCFQTEMRCTKEHCPYADGYYDRINGALLDMLANETLMTRPVIESYARKHSVCPFEFALDAAYAADAVICDYNYAFDPRVSLKRLFEEQKRRTALLIDEAHNLVDRAREMYSSELNKADFLAIQREYKTVQPELHAAAKRINSYFIEARKQAGVGKMTVTTERPDELNAMLETFAAQAERHLIAVPANADSGQLLDTYFAVQSFLRIAKLYDERYVTYSEDARDGFRIKLMCLDPSYLLKQMGKGYRSQVFFSATLSPLGYFMDMLGGDKEDDYSVSIPSPFSSDQLTVELAPLSTRYQDRDRTKDAIARHIRRVVAEKPGNYFAFFPSYAYMNSVYECFMELEITDAVDTIVQQTAMTEEERESYLRRFQAENERPLIGFAVMGGIFSEGIDLVGDRLKGVVVVGVGLPQLCAERNLLKDFFDGGGKNGYDYAYVYPGMNKVLQAGGRLIRSATDRGTLLLIDDRYLKQPYNRLLPAEWKHYELAGLEPESELN